MVVVVAGAAICVHRLPAPRAAALPSPQQLLLSPLHAKTLTPLDNNATTQPTDTNKTKATEHEDLKLLLSKAQVIDELESTLPKWVERLMPDAFPAYVHVLRVCCALRCVACFGGRR